MRYETIYEDEVMRLDAKDGEKIFRLHQLSDWIEVEHGYKSDFNDDTVLDDFDYYADESGFMDFFVYAGYAWAIDRFYRLSYPIDFENEDGKTSFIVAYDSQNYHNPIMIEVSDYGYVRVYEEDTFKSTVYNTEE